MGRTSCGLFLFHGWGNRSMDIFSLILPFAISIFSKLPCLSPDVSPDPQAALKAQQNSDGTFKPAFLRQHRGETRRSIRAANKGKHRRDPSFIPPNSVDLDAQTTRFFQHVLNAPKAAVKAGLVVGRASPLTDE